MTLRERLLGLRGALGTGFSPKSRPDTVGRAILSKWCMGRLASAVRWGYRSANKKSRRTPGRLFAYFSETATMKSDIHPNYHMIKVVMTNGVEFMTRSTYGEEGATLNLDIDPNTHPAWTGGSQQLLDRGGRLSRFNTRFGGIGLGAKK
jgi:large subunit ribosomal protein L31